MSPPQKVPPTEDDRMLFPFVVLVLLTIAGAALSYVVLGMQLSSWGL
jgi:hypothetical protein